MGNKNKKQIGDKIYSDVRNALQNSKTFRKDITELLEGRIQSIDYFKTTIANYLRTLKTKSKKTFIRAKKKTIGEKLLCKHRVKKVNSKDVIIFDISRNYEKLLIKKIEMLESEKERLQQRKIKESDILFQFSLSPKVDSIKDIDKDGNISYHVPNISTKEINKNSVAIGSIGYIELCNKKNKKLLLSDVLTAKAKKTKVKNKKQMVKLRGKKDKKKTIKDKRLAKIKKDYEKRIKGVKL